MRSLALALLVGLAPAPSPAPRLNAGPAAELAAVRKTRALLEQRLAEKDALLKERVRSLYKLTRGGLSPLWLESEERARLVRSRAAARRVIVRDLEERKLLLEELALAGRAEERLLAELSTAEPPAPRSLRRPVVGRVVAGFGPYLDRPARARLHRNGVELAAAPGELVLAPTAGKVLYAGRVRGLGEAVLLEPSPGVVIVIGGLAAASVKAGQMTFAGLRLGPALGGRVTIEVRVAGRPVDPVPLLD
jgi:septal ring factor EnvC (AmiA/AmiB activator)